MIICQTVFGPTNTLDKSESCIIFSQGEKDAVTVTNTVDVYILVGMKDRLKSSLRTPGLAIITGDLNFQSSPLLLLGLVLATFSHDVINSSFLQIAELISLHIEILPNLGFCNMKTKGQTETPQDKNKSAFSHYS